MKRAQSFVIAIVVITSMGAAPVARAAQRRAALAEFSMPGNRVVIREAMEIEAHCRVDGVIDERTGRDGKPYGIGFAVALPANWNGRFLFQGGGGSGESVPGESRPPCPSPRHSHYNGSGDAREAANYTCRE